MTFKVNIKSISQLECLSATEKSRLDDLNVLASLLLRPCIFRDIVQNTLPIIPDLCARWNSTSFNYVPCNKHHTNHLSSGSPKHMQDGELIKNSDSDLPFQMLMTYARLVPLLPYLKTFCLSAMSSHFTLLDTIDVLNTTEFSKLRYRNMMQSIYRLVSFSVQDFNSCWNTTKLYEMLEYPDYVSRWYAASALALLLGMSDKQSTELINKCIPKLEQQNVLVHILQDRDQTHQDKLMLFQKNEEYSTKLDVGDFSQLAIEDTVLDSSNLSPYTVDVCGVVLPHESLYRQDATKKGDANESDFVVTPKCSKVLHEMAIAMSCELPILLEGFAGVGKTAIVEAAGKMVGSRELLKIHLGDQTDSKLLLGTYMTGATPGTFKWQQGVLTTAVREGRWILIEDIDLAPVDVIAILLPLLETRWLHIPSRGERHRAKDGFRIFATRRALKPHVSNHTDFPRSVGENLWAKIYVPVFTGDEIDQILHSRFPNLRPILPLIHSVYERLCVLAQENALGRNISIRDLIKWCTRVDRLNPHHDFSNTNSLDEMQVREILFREGFDCFSAMIPNQKILHSFTLELGNVLELSEHRIQYYLDHHIPVVNVDSDSVQFGRVSIKKNTATVPKDESKFATTTPSIRLLERLAVCCALNEPVLLVGETGTGKTTVVQRLSAQLGHRLIVINMSQQSDSTDLLGGFKPVDALMLATPLKEKFDALFSSTFSVKQNGPFLDSIKSTFIRKKWDALIVGFRNAIKMAEKVAKQQKATQQIGDSNEKKKKVRKILDSSLFIEWENFSNMVNQFHAQMNQIKSNFLFFFVEGSLVKAIREGYWILLDEINLATAETLECLSGLLQSDVGSVMLLERGDTTPIARHPNFRLFACMNPATDAGKRNLPNGLRSRFTEFWVDSPDSNLSDLLLIIKTYLFGHLPPGSIGEQLCHDIAKFYKGAKELSVNGLLFDGADQRVHVSMRTLTRALSCASFAASVYGVRRSLYEGCYMTFMTGLGAKSFDQMLVLLSENILNGVSNPTSFIKQIPPNPSPNHTDSDTTSPYSLVECFWLEKGQYEIPEDIDSLFVLTPSVKANLCNLARGCLSRKYPVLIQGPTSAGKTSMIEYLAKRTGHRFIRINNHEHTDLQEYLGSYMSNDQGVLVFQEGVLVEALRKGYWIVLDELNLAPSDVLEALNRLLDDNRELFLPEKQEVIKPHPHFMLFATQNPAGQYGGRKQLSRAFRNRFLELHFSDIPECELETIIEKRCLIPPSYAKKCVAVYRQLCKSRDASRIFDGRQSFITLRDLFRWALRRANGYENLAQDGYMLIAERVRNPADREVIQRIIEKELKVKLNMSDYYTNQFDLIQQNLKDVYTGKPMPKVVWTQAMQKLFVLIYNATIHQEPVLLIGETGCGKTTVCQVLSALFDQELHIVNAHQNSETADFLGSQRPARGRDVHEVQLRKLFNELLIKVNDLSDIDIEASSLTNLETLYFKLKDSHAGEFQKEFEELFKTLVKAKSLFEWCDGPLIQAMKKGDMFLLDEISLADDSVLERLNSVLEPGRSLTLVEKSGLNVDEIKANEKFHFFATMNPGGDYGKKELSPALRNRFTELWVPQVSNREDLHLIITDRLEGIQCPKEWATKILQFLEWLAETLHKPVKSIISLRDVLAWASFILSLSHNIGVKKSYYHGGCMVLVDGIGINPLFGIVVKSKTLVLDAYCKLKALAGYDGADLENVNFVATDSGFGSHPFMVSFGEVQRKEVKFSLNAPTTMQNCLRVLRALQLSKPILLEGSPGAGKTSLVTTLAELSGHPLCRINLSEQTDLMDLFGSDLPVEGGRGGEFAWRDGPFLKAMQTGEWVLLDELNLASQQVLEGLNACLDHRATVYIPELDRHFSCHPNFRVFAAQNPQSQGGGRKGLPKSFINRFSLVYVQELQIDDIRLICQQLYPNLSNELVNRMITFNEQIKLNTMDLHTFGWLGSPWEFNLRDILRWIELLIHSPSGTDPGEYLNLLYVQRMRSQPDREAVRKIYQEVFGHVPEQCMMTPAYRISPNFIKIGSQFHSRKSNRGKHMHGVPADHLQLLPSSLTVFESLLKCVHSKTTALLVGPPGSGKSSAVRLLANICGEKLEEFSLNPGVDALELLGGFEQVDLVRNLQEILDYLGNIVEFVQKDLLLTQKSSKSIMELHRVWNAILGTTNQSECINRCMSLLDSLKQCYAKPEDLSIIEKRISGLIKLINSGVKGQFEWMDSTLINAMEEGSWILIDNVNMCSSSVLDRLNSLLEVGGLLAINERGLVDGEVKIVKPHENFRMFMAMDPRQGEISRAMRNRSIELYICDLDADQNAKLLTSSKAFDEIGLPGSFFANMLDKRLKNCGEIPPLKIKLFLEHLRRGDHYAKSLEELDISSVSNTTFEDIQWRDYASGSLVSHNSQLSHGIVDVSIITRVFEESKDWIGMNSFPIVPPAHVLLKAAVNLYINLTSGSDKHLRMACLDFQVAKFGNDNALEYIKVFHSDRPELLADIERIRESLLVEFGLFDYSNDLPLDIRTVNIYKSGVAQWSQYTYLLEKLLIERSVRHTRTVEEFTYAEAAKCSIQNLNISQLSYLAHSRVIRAGSLHHPSIQYLYPLLETIDEVCLSDDIDILFSKTILNHRSNLWDTLQSKNYEFDQIFVILQGLNDFLKENHIESYLKLPSYEQLKELLERISQSLSLPKFEACSVLWNYNGSKELVKKPLWDIGMALENLNSSMNIWNMNPQGNIYA
ncbi:P-loop containing nucleoside triphosphate hydrolase protein [Globomyces pollinis-pini]|nr:P-loop containing nucleoside triphosphate hydrolase protein [Globomyces pollinis-pini]